MRQTTVSGLPKTFSALVRLCSKLSAKVRKAPAQRKCLFNPVFVWCNTQARLEIGYPCFALNIKGGRGFPGISLHNPIKRSGCLILIPRETNGKQLGRGHCGGWVGGVWRGWRGARVWENVRWGEERDDCRGEWIERSWMNRLCIWDTDPTVWS